MLGNGGLHLNDNLLVEAVFSVNGGGYRLKKNDLGCDFNYRKLELAVGYCFWVIFHKLISKKGSVDTTLLLV